jgi:hypothetical protein
MRLASAAELLGLLGRVVAHPLRATRSVVLLFGTVLRIITLD